MGSIDVNKPLEEYFCESQEIDGKRLSWIKGQVIYEDKRVDNIDLLNTCILHSAILNNDQILIINPNKNSSHIPLLFACTVLMQWLDCQTKGEKKHVVYVGTTINVRNESRKMVLRDLKKSLSTFFPQDTKTANQNPYIPRVTFVYNPSEPIETINEIIKSDKIDCIILDCEDKPKIKWVEPMIKYAEEKSIPLIAWCQNPFSSAVSDFTKYGHLTFVWLSHESSTKPVIIDDVFKTRNCVKIEQLLIDSPFDQDFIKSYNHLNTAYKRNRERFILDAISIGFNYLRAIESLSIPLDLYEYESRKLWGIKPLAHWNEAFSKFNNIILQNNKELGNLLEDVRIDLEIVNEKLLHQDPPLWYVLKKIYLEHVKKGCFEGITEAEKLNVLIFPSIAKKKLFLLAFLSRFRLTEKDLRDNNIVITSLIEFRKEVALLKQNEISQGLFLDTPIENINPIIIGLPSPSALAKLDVILDFKECKFILYSYQKNALANRLESLNENIHADIENNYKVLSKYLKNEELYEKIDKLRILDIDESLSKMLSTPSEDKETKGEEIEKSIAIEIDLEKELEKLFTLDEDYRHIGDNERYLKEKQDIILDRVIELNFDEGLRIFLDPEDTINVVNELDDAGRLTQKKVDSLESGDKIVFIEGQKKQDLYDLIIARTHKNPAIEVHLAMIEKWHEEFFQAFMEKCQEDITPDELLHNTLTNIRKKGSNITSISTIYGWVVGNVLCPNDPEDLKRLAEIFDLGFVRGNYKQIYIASGRLRSIHRSLSMRINKWILKKSIEDEDLDNIVDEELGLTLRDFKDSIRIFEIGSINELEGPFYAENLGRIIVAND